jgi:hypothetical protein
MKGPREGDLSEADGENNLQNFVLRENQQIVLPVSKARRHLLIFEKR